MRRNAIDRTEHVYANEVITLPQNISLTILPEFQSTMQEIFSVLEAEATRIPKKIMDPAVASQLEKGLVEAPSQLPDDDDDGDDDTYDNDNGDLAPESGVNDESTKTTDQPPLNRSRVPSWYSTQIPEYVRGAAGRLYNRYPVEAMESVFPRKGISADLRHAGFGAFCGCLYNTYQNFPDRNANYGRHNVRAIIEGYNPKDLTETKYRFSEFDHFNLVFSCFLSHFRQGNDRYDPKAALLAYALSLDAVLHPRNHILAARQWGSSELGDRAKAPWLLEDLAKALLQVWEYIGQEIPGYPPGSVSSLLTDDCGIPVRGLVVLVFSLSKYCYDSPHRVNTKTGVFEWRGDFNITPIPFLDTPAIGEPGTENSLLWMQFNKVAFVEENRDIKPFDPPVSGDFPEGDSKDASELDDFDPIDYRDYILHRLQQVHLIGSAGSAYVCQSSRLHFARLTLPANSITWHDIELADLTAEYRRHVQNPLPSSQFVFAVGPYGTAKTTVCQYLFHSSVAAKNAGNWHILSWNPNVQLLELKSVPTNRAMEYFRECELSRVIDPRSALRLTLDQSARGGQIVLNLSELNASSEPEMLSVLKGLERITREIREKLLPSKLIVFVSMQGYALTKVLNRFLDKRPDLALGRARLDTVWIIRGDVPQYYENENGKTRREYLKRMAESLLKLDEEDPFVDEIVDWVRMDGPIKAKLYLQKLAEMKPSIYALTKVSTVKKTYIPFRQKNVRRFLDLALPRLTALEPALQRLANTSKTELEQADATIFQNGFGTYASTTVALANGFIRQVLDMIITEMWFRVCEHTLFRGLSVGTPHEDDYVRENQARGTVMDHTIVRRLANTRSVRLYCCTLNPNRAQGNSGYYLMDKEAQEAAKTLMDGSGKALKVNYDRYIAGQNDQFDLGLIQEQKVRESGRRSAIHHFIDFTTSLGRGATDKAITSRPILTIVWTAPEDNSHTDDGQESSKAQAVKPQNAVVPADATAKRKQTDRPFVPFRLRILPKFIEVVVEKLLTGRFEKLGTVPGTKDHYAMVWDVVVSPTYPDVVEKFSVSVVLANPLEEKDATTWAAGLRDALETGSAFNDRPTFEMGTWEAFTGGQKSAKKERPVSPLKLPPRAKEKPDVPPNLVESSPSAPHNDAAASAQVEPPANGKSKRGKVSKGRNRNDEVDGAEPTAITGQSTRQDSQGNSGVSDKYPPQSTPRGAANKAGGGARKKTGQKRVPKTQLRSAKPENGQSGSAGGKKTNPK